MKIVKRVAIALILLLLLVAVLTVASLPGSVASTSGERAVAGLAQPVEIRFDALQRPYVHAATIEDALFAQGWLHARHRLWQMEMFRRAGQGRLAELLGPSMLDSDKELWRLGVPQLAKQLEANASDHLRGLVAAYISGVNEGIDSLRIRPPEFLMLQASPQTWRPADVYALGAVMAYQSAGNFENELLRHALFQEVGAERAAIFLPDESQFEYFPYVIDAVDAKTSLTIPQILRRMAATDPLDTLLLPRFAFGSNAWVVAPSHSESGNALFAFDSHDALGLPNLFYEVHLFFGDGRQLRGWSVAGLPGVINGYNERISWGFTNIGDSQDLFLETRSDTDELKFKDGEYWYEARVEMVEIPMKGRDEAEQLRIIHTKNGPLISEDPPIALRWTVQEMNGLGMDSLIDLNLAQNWEEFSDAMDRFAAPPLNASYADVDGNIGFRTAGLLPKRGRGEGLLPLPGDDAESRWQGIIAPEDMPRLFNPPEGFIAAANARISPAGMGPLVSADNAPGYRIQRLQDVLSSNAQHNAEDMRKLQMDWHDSQAERLLPAMIEGLAGTSETQLEVDALQSLEDWRQNLKATPDSAAALIFQAWYRALARAVFEPALSEGVFNELHKSNYPLNHALDRLILSEENSDWWEGGREAVLRGAFKEALAVIGNALGGDVSKWRLDSLHRVKLEHDLGKAVPQLDRLFNLPAAPWGGSTSTVGRARYRYDRGLDVTGAATVRVVGEMSDPPSMAAVMPSGQSGHPLSGHYDDQFEAWLGGELFPISASWDDVSGDVFRLIPGDQ
jgi:penicillin G amidase